MELEPFWHYFWTFSFFQIFEPKIPFFWYYFFLKTFLNLRMEERSFAIIFCSGHRRNSYLHFYYNQHGYHLYLQWTTMYDTYQNGSIVVCRWMKVKLTIRLEPFYRLVVNYSTSLYVFIITVVVLWHLVLSNSV